MNDKHARHDALNAIAAGKAHAQLMERRVRRGVARNEDLSEGLLTICAAFDRLTEFCEEVTLPEDDDERSDAGHGVKRVLIARDRE